MENNKKMKQDEFLEILKSAYEKGESQNTMTTKELVEDIVYRFKEVYISK